MCFNRAQPIVPDVQITHLTIDMAANAHAEASYHTKSELDPLQNKC